MKDSHYLKNEIYGLVSSNPDIFEFLQNGSLDGLWYWDLENPENEWLNAQFWDLLGYDPEEKKHLAKEWQNLIDPEDLKIATDNFNRQGHHGRSYFHINLYNITRPYRQILKKFISRA